MWFSSSTAIILGVSIGVILFVCYIFWVVLSTYAMKKGKYQKYKKVIYSLIFIVTGIGITTLTLFIVAITTGQPYHVWYPLMMVGSFGCMWTIGIFIMNKARKKFITIGELNKMNIDDLS
ncbi:MAG: hypothetical protein FWF15_00765 [Oscillospiraceae bacterium]|nr:hypothetical protein [Oscillospiraceae bacterium]